MTREEIIAAVRKSADAIRAEGVTKLALFGSRVRGDNRPDSDIDVLIEIEPDASFSLLNLIDVEHIIEDATGLQAQATMRRSLPLQFAPTILSKCFGVRPTLADRIGHIAEAINNVRRILAGHTRASFANDLVVRLAVERLLEVISEASRFIPADLKAKEQTINWRGLADLGNWRRHAYHRTDAGLLWGMIENDLEPLEDFVNRISKEAKPRLFSTKRASRSCWLPCLSRRPLPPSASPTTMADVDGLRPHVAWRANALSSEWVQSGIQDWNSVRQRSASSGAVSSATSHSMKVRSPSTIGSRCMVP